MASSSSFDDQQSKAKKLIFDLDPTRFLTFLSNLSSPNNAFRSDAVNLYNFIKKDYPNSLCFRLANLLIFSPRAQTRSLSAVILRRLVSRDWSSIWSHLSTMCQNDLKRILLDRLQNEKDLEVSKNLCSTAAALAVDLLPRNQWPEFNLFLFHSLRSASTHGHFAVFLLFAELLPKIGVILSVHEDKLHEACVEFMKPSSLELDPHVRAAAVGASVGLIVCLSTESSHEKFTDLLGYMVHSLLQLINIGEDGLAGKVLEDMIVLAGAATGILRTPIDYFVGSMLMIVEDESLEEKFEKTKELAIEFLLTVAEDRKQGCGMIEKMNDSVTRLLSVLMKMLVFIEDDPSWHKAGSDEYNAGESSKFFYGMESLGRLAVALRGDAIVPNYPEVLPEFLDDLDWRKRHAAVTALMLISEGSSKVVLNEHLDKLVEKVLYFFNDPHPRVRWAAINAIGQFSKDLGPQLQHQFHQQLVPALTETMDDFQNPRVQVFEVKGGPDDQRGSKTHIWTKLWSVRTIRQGAEFHFDLAFR